MLPNNQDGGPAPAAAANEQRRGGADADLNDWLPITASRKAKWWYSAFHNVTAMVGAGVLGLPLALARLGWIPGIIAILVSWLITWYTLWILCELHEAEGGRRRFDRFTELGQYAFGEKLGNWVVMPQQLVVQVGSNIVYMVTGGKSLQKGLSLAHPDAFEHIHRSYYILAFALIQLVLSQVPNFNSLKLVSLLAAIMSVSYSMIATAASCAVVHSHYQHDVHVPYTFKSHSTTGIVMGVFSSLGVLAFAFAGHSVALEIQATIPSTPETPSKIPMWKGVVVAYIIVASCYFPVAICGYWAFGSDVDDDVLLSLLKPVWLISTANLMVFFHVVGSYQVFAMPVFDKIEYMLVKKFKFTPGRPVRLVSRSAYVALTGFIAVLLPFFGGLLGFFGGLAFTITSYIIPCSIWLKLRRPKRFSFHWFACWISIAIGTGITAVAPIGGMHEIVVQWKQFTLF